MTGDLHIYELLLVTCLQGRAVSRGLHAMCSTYSRYVLRTKPVFLEADEHVLPYRYSDVKLQDDTSFDLSY